MVYFFEKFVVDLFRGADSHSFHHSSSGGDDAAKSAGWVRHFFERGAVVEDKMKGCLTPYRAGWWCLTN